MMENSCTSYYSCCWPLLTLPHPIHSLPQTLYNSMMENNCSEQSSRMSAMENSTKNAGEMLGKVCFASFI